MSRLTSLLARHTISGQRGGPVIDPFIEHWNRRLTYRLIHPLMEGTHREVTHYIRVSRLTPLLAHHTISIQGGGPVIDPLIEQWNRRLTYRLIHPQGGTLIFSSYIGSGPASTVHPKKMEFQAPQKIFEILASQKIPPILYLDL